MALARPARMLRPADSSDSGVAAVTRTLAILDVFTLDAPYLGLSEISRRVGLPKATTQRLLKTLAAAGYVAQNDTAHWRLGPATASLATRYQMSFDIHSNIEPVLRRLSDDTGQDTSFFIQEGNRRIRLVKVMCRDGPHGATRVGESMPMDLGSPGKVMLAATGQQGALFDGIRARGFHVTVGEAKKTSASIAVPVFGSRWRVVGALCIGARVAPGIEATLAGFAPRLKRAGQVLSAALSYDGDAATRRVTIARSTWHP